MKYCSLTSLLFLLNTGSYVSADELAKGKVSSYIGDFQYGDPVGERYLTVTLLSDGKVVRTLHAELGSGGAFEREVPPRFSPDGDFVLLNQVESAELETPSGPVISETAYCSLVGTQNGCIVARETGEFCAGTFTLDGRWANSLYPEFNLAAVTPSARAYVMGKLKPVGSPETSFENLMVCDPPNTKNADEYRTIMEDNIFDLDSAQTKALRRSLK